MKRAGFTMIELIFVIVILGILAAVAIPKLAATRDDAKVAKGANELATVIGDIGNYYTSKGYFSTMETMTNVPFTTNNGADFNTTGSTETYEGCITLTSKSSTGLAGSAADSIEVKYNFNGASAICSNIASAAVGITGYKASNVDSNKTHTFGGSGVNFN